MPHLYPLVKLADQSPLYAVCVADSKHARLVVCGLGEVLTEEDFAALLELLDPVAEAAGYDSVCGKAGHTKSWGAFSLQHDEFILYRPEQQTIRYLITFER